MRKFRKKNTHPGSIQLHCFVVFIVSFSCSCLRTVLSDERGGVLSDEATCAQDLLIPFSATEQNSIKNYENGELNDAGVKEV